MKDAKPPVVPNYQPAVSRGGRGCGCFAAGCGITLLAFVMMCVGSYYLTMHTSFPLTMIERAIESEGNVKVEGLSGSISSGFQIEKLEFEGDGGKWSELRDVKFTFNGFLDLARNERLIISEASVGGGTIYAEFENDGEFDFDPELDGEEIAEEFSDEMDELRRELEGDDDLQQLAELRIEKVSVNDLQIINPKTEVSLEVKRAEFNDFQMLRGQITQLGNLLVESDQLDVKTTPSTVFADQQVAMNLKGQVKSRLHKKLHSDVPFEIDFAIADKNELLARFDLFDGKIKIDEPFQTTRKYEFVDFSPADYFEMTPPLAPSNWNATLAIEQTEIKQDSTDAEEPAARPSEPQWVMTINEGGSFRLGSTTFNIETDKIFCDEKENAQWPPVIATGNLADQTVTATLTLLDELPYVAVALSSEQTDDVRDLWAKLFFDASFADLDVDQQAQVIETVEFAKGDDGNASKSKKDDTANSESG